jgi:RES domain-containing protein
MIYTASSLALALLEMLVHVKPDQIPDYMWVAAEVQDRCVDFPDSLPADPADYGTKWLEIRGGKIALAVPFVIVPENNILFNPDHTDFSSIQWTDPLELKIDPRLLYRAPLALPSA